MNFEDEHYVRIYTRKTKTVKKWGWEGRVLFRELMTVVDKAGVLDDIDSPVEDVALMAELPEDLVEVGLPKLLDSGAVEIRGKCLVIPNYLAGQTANKSDKNRAKESRQRRAAAARLDELRGPSGGVTNCDDGVTHRTARDDSEHERADGDGVTRRDDGVTDCDGADTNRSKTSRARPPASPNAGTTQRSPTQSNATQEQRTDPARPIPCPEDLQLAEPQVKALETSGDMIPRWGIQAIRDHVVPNWASDPDKTKTLPEWRSYLRATIHARWKDPKTRPRKPEPRRRQSDIDAELKAQEEAAEAHRRRLLEEAGESPGAQVIDYGDLLKGVK